jgi:hypothetical protein
VRCVRAHTCETKLRRARRRGLSTSPGPAQQAAAPLSQHGFAAALLRCISTSLDERRRRARRETAARAWRASSARATGDSLLDELGDAALRAASPGRRTSPAAAVDVIGRRATNASQLRSAAASFAKSRADASQTAATTVERAAAAAAAAQLEPEAESSHAQSLSPFS